MKSELTWFTFFLIPFYIFSVFAFKSDMSHYRNKKVCEWRFMLTLMHTISYTILPQINAYAAGVRRKKCRHLTSLIHSLFLLFPELFKIRHQGLSVSREGTSSNPRYTFPQEGGSEEGTSGCSWRFISSFINPPSASTLTPCCLMRPHL